VSDASFDPTEGEQYEGSILRVYVAAASSEMERAEKVMQALRDTGITVVSTWPQVIRKVGKANPMDAPRRQRAEWAAQDLTEVAQANVLWLLLPEKETIGAWIEFGHALMIAAAAERAAAMGLPGAFYRVICSGKERSIFTALVEHFETDDAALDTLNAFEDYLASGEDEDNDEDDEEYEEIVEKTAPSMLSPELERQLNDIFKPK